MSKPQSEIHEEKQKDSPDQVVLNPEANTASMSLTASDDSIDDRVLLKNTDSPNLFLAKVGLIFITFWLLLMLVCIIAALEPDFVREIYFRWGLMSYTWIYAIVPVLFLFTFAVFGQYIRSFAIVGFIATTFASMIIVLSIYIYFDGYLKTQYVGHGYYVFLMITSLFGGSIGFILSALFRDRKRLFNYWLGFVLCELFALIPLIILPYIWKNDSVTFIKLCEVFAIVCVFHIYLTIDMHQILNYRRTKFYDNDYIYCFLCFWTDIFYLFWANIMHRKRAANLPDVVIPHDQSVDMNGKVIHIRDDL